MQLKKIVLEWRPGEEEAKAHTALAAVLVAVQDIPELLHALAIEILDVMRLIEYRDVPRYLPKEAAI